MSSIPLKDLDLNSSGDPDDGVESKSDGVDVSIEEKHEMGIEEKEGLAVMGEGGVEKVDIESNVVEVVSGVAVVEGKESDGGQGGLEKVDINANAGAVDGVTETGGDRNAGSLVCDISVSPEMMGVEGKESDGLSKRDRGEGGLEKVDINGDVGSLFFDMSGTMEVEGRMGALGGEKVGEGRLDKVDINANVEVVDVFSGMNVGTLVCDISASPEKGCDTMEAEGGVGALGGETVGEGRVDKLDINANVEVVDGASGTTDDRNVGTIVCDLSVSPEKGHDTMDKGRVGALGGDTAGEGRLDKVDINGNVEVVDGVIKMAGDQNMGTLVCDISLSPDKGRDMMEAEGTESDGLNKQDGDVGALVGEMVGEGSLDKVDINKNVEVVNVDTETAKDQNMGILVCDISVYPEKGCEAMEVDVGRTEIEGLTKQDGDKSQSSLYDRNMGSLIVDLGPAFRKEAELTARLDENVIDGGGVGKEIVEAIKQVAVIEPPKGGGFSNSDLVWGKVKTHPWWPGQIIDPLYASELAMKLYKKGTYLVAYFGDRSFAWNEPVTLKPFKDHFSQLEKQTNAVAFCDSVNCALEEISRRVQLGLSCSCIPEAIYDGTKLQIVVNAGVQENLCLMDGVDRSFSVTSFEPFQLLEYLKSLALYQGNVGGRMELVIAQAQIGAFYSSKGYFQLPQFDISSLLSEHAENATPVYHIEEKAHSGRGRGKARSQKKSNTKALDRLEDSLKSRKKERSLTELMEPKLLLIGDSEKGESEAVVPYSGTKRKNVESSSGDATAKRGRRRLLSSIDRDAGTESPISKDPQVGQRIRNIARQLSGSPPVFKLSGDSVQKSDFKVDGKSIKLNEVDVDTQIEDRTLGRITVAKEYSSPDVMLSQLYLAARDPMKGYSFVDIVVDFFTDFRNSNARGRSFTVQHKNSEKVSSGEKIVKKRKQSNSKVHLTRSFEYEAVSDSYWTDRIILSTPDEQVSQKKPKRNTDPLAEIPLKSSTTFEPETSHASSLVSDSKKNGSTLESVNELQHNPTVDYTQKCTDENSNLVAEKSVDNKNSEEISPTSLILNFTDAKSIPLESDLNRIFSQFESLKGSETKLLRKTKQAKVVFERRSDAEEAYTRACKFSVFGPALVSYFLTPLKASPRTRRQTRKGATSLKGGDSN